MNNYKLIDKDDGFEGIITIKNTYSKESIFATTYAYLDKGYFLIDSNENDEFIIKIELKNNNKDKEELNTLIKEILNDLINYETYFKEAKDTKELRETLLKRALLTNSITEEENEEKELDNILESLEND